MSRVHKFKLRIARLKKLLFVRASRTLLFFDFMVPLILQSMLRTFVSIFTLTLPSFISCFRYNIAYIFVHLFIFVAKNTNFQMFIETVLLIFWNFVRVRSLTILYLSEDWRRLSSQSF